MAGDSKTDAARRIAELTGLGIAATYFLDPMHGAQRRRTAWRLIAGGRAPQVGVEEQPAVEPVRPAPPEPVEPPEPPEELVLLGSDRPVATAPLRDEVVWPSWGWALVLTITVCAIAAFAAVGIGIWAIEHRGSTKVRTITRPDFGAASVLADPTARRIIGTASRGRVLLRLDADGAALAVDGLPTLPAQTTYRVWITTAGVTSPAGEFTGRRAVLALSAIAPGSRITITRPSGSQVATLTVSP